MYLLLNLLWKKEMEKNTLYLLKRLRHTNKRRILISECKEKSWSNTLPSVVSDTLFLCSTRKWNKGYFLNLNRIDPQNSIADLALDQIWAHPNSIKKLNRFDYIGTESNSNKLFFEISTHCMMWSINLYILCGY
jgi:hypothetical protein